MLLTPADRVDIGGRGITPIIEHIRPPVEINQKLTFLVDFGDCSHTDEGGIGSILGLQFHPGLEAFGGGGSGITFRARDTFGG